MPAPLNPLPQQNPDLPTLLRSLQSDANSNDDLVQGVLTDILEVDEAFTYGESLSASSSTTPYIFGQCTFGFAEFSSRPTNATLLTALALGRWAKIIADGGLTNANALEVAGIGGPLLTLLDLYYSVS